MPIFLFLSASLFLTSCATLFGDKDKSVRVSTKPSGAKVYLNGAPVGTTPATIQIASTLSANMILIKKRGYEDITVPIITSVQPVAFLNLLNLLCWGIDLATGNVMRIDSKYIQLDLSKSTAMNSTINNKIAMDFSRPLECTTL
jgi:hypothetical protein